MSDETGQKSMRDMTIEELEAYLDSDEYRKAWERELTPSQRRLIARSRREGPYSPEQWAELVARNESQLTDSDLRWRKYLDEMDSFLADPTGTVPEPKKYWLKD